MLSLFKNKKRKEKRVLNIEKNWVASLKHFAILSQGLSHTHFWGDLEKGLRDSFSSGVNKGYKEPKYKE